MYSVSQVYSSSGGAEGSSAVASLVDKMPSITSGFGTGASTSAIAEYIASPKLFTDCKKVIVVACCLNAFVSFA